MPMKRTGSGFMITYSRIKCAVFGLVAVVFALTMIAVGLNEFFPLLAGTPLEGFDITRRPPEVWGAVAFAGGFVALYVAGWNGKNAFFSGVAISITPEKVEARSLVGRRSLSWAEVGRAQVISGTVALIPIDEENAKPVPLQTHLTSVKVDEVKAAIEEMRPGLF